MAGDRRAWTVDCPFVAADPPASFLIRRHAPDGFTLQRYGHLSCLPIGATLAIPYCKISALRLYTHSEGGKRYRVVVGQYIKNQTDIEIFENRQRPTHDYTAVANSR